MTDLADTTTLLGLLADATRMRLLVLLGAQELSVAELTRITAVPQSRVSTHLGKLKDAGFLRDRKVGTSTFYRVDEARMPAAARIAWQAVVQELDDAVLADDAERCDEVLQARISASHWPDAVAGQMEHHYSPGRTWEATARAFVGLIDLGDVLDVGSGDGVIAQLLAPRANRYVCLDRSAKVIDAARARLDHLANVEFLCGDMHEVALPERSVDHVLSFSVLTYADDPARCVAEWFRLLRPGGRLVLVTLDEHHHHEIADAYEHLHRGFAPARLQALLEDAGFTVDRCEVAARERKKPYFDVVCAFASRPAGPRTQPSPPTRRQGATGRSQDEVLCAPRRASRPRAPEPT
ncbi:MAG: metalloregulator ArsR/SmtB family transcription factor [Deltaproteobacteria bacterium]|nr:metalloregulator ArsR/SmtB family transcription factor [Deltaproteobacteria bacterium]